MDSRSSAKSAVGSVFGARRHDVSSYESTDTVMIGKFVYIVVVPALVLGDGVLAAGASIACYVCILVKHWYRVHVPESKDAGATTYVS